MSDRGRGPYPDNPGATHYPGCWREPGHHNCAVERVRELEQALEKIEALVMEYLTGQFLDPVAVCTSVRDTSRHALNKEKEDNGR